VSHNVMNTQYSTWIDLSALSAQITWRHHLIT
jgi:hypothetical protein